VKLKKSDDIESIQQLDDWLEMDRETAFKQATDSGE
jgi:hypothetical protein